MRYIGVYDPSTTVREVTFRLQAMAVAEEVYGECAVICAVRTSDGGKAQVKTRQRSPMLSS